MITMICAALACLAYVVLVVVTRRESRIIKLTVWLYAPITLSLVAVAIFAAK